MPDRDALVQRLNEIADTVAEHAQASDDELDRTYRRGGWTARQVLAHLGDTAIGNLFRFYRAVAEEGKQAAQPVVRVHQRLCAHPLARHQVDLRLEMMEELVVCESSP